MPTIETTNGIQQRIQMINISLHYYLYESSIFQAIHSCIIATHSSIIIATCRIIYCHSISSINIRYFTWISKRGISSIYRSSDSLYKCMPWSSSISPSHICLNMKKVAILELKSCYRSSKKIWIYCDDYRLEDIFRRHMSELHYKKTMCIVVSLSLFCQIFFHIELFLSIAHSERDCISQQNSYSRAILILFYEIPLHHSDLTLLDLYGFPNLGCEYHQRQQSQCPQYRYRNDREYELGTPELHLTHSRILLLSR